MHDVISWPFLVLALVVCASSALQSAAGFAYALLLAPVLLTAGYTLPEVVTISLLTSTLQKLIVIRHLHAAIEWKPLLPLMGTGVLALPIGVWVMYHATALSPDAIKQIIGGVVIALLLVQWLGRVPPCQRVHPGWGHLAAVGSGLLNGFAGIGGPPIVLWCLAHDWPGEKLRVTTIAYTLAFAIPQTVLLYIAFGPAIVPAAARAALAMPAVVIGSYLGLAIGGKLPTPRVIALIRLVLLAVALDLLVRPLLVR